MLLPKAFVTVKEAFLSPWTGCDEKERDVVREMKYKERDWQLLSEGGFSFFSRILSQCDDFVPFWNERVFSFQTCHRVSFVV